MMEAAGGRTRRIAWRAWLALRSGWPAAAWGFAGAFGADTFLPVSNVLLPAVAAAALATLAAACFAVGEAMASRADAPPQASLRGLPTLGVLERSNTAQQLGHAFAVSAIALGSLSLGFWVAELAGF
jgi:hypothetical protein